VCSKGTAAAVLTLVSCLIHAVDDGELTLDLGKKKKKKKKDAAAEPAVSLSMARVARQQPKACSLYCMQLMPGSSLYHALKQAYLLPPFWYIVCRCLMVHTLLLQHAVNLMCSPFKQIFACFTCRQRMAVQQQQESSQQRMKTC
jgi:hypothetical protein